MPVSQDFKDTVAHLLVRKQTEDAPSRGVPPDENMGTHIKQPLARPKKDKAHQDQTRLALAAVASVKARRENRSKQQPTSNERLSIQDKTRGGEIMVKPSEIDESKSCVTC